MAISVFDPELSAFINRVVFDTVDMLIGDIISGICQFCDENLHTSFFTEAIQPLLYGTYMFFSDKGGTVARLIVGIGATVSGIDSSLVNLVIMDDFERQIMSGEAFNMDDYYDPPE